MSKLNIHLFSILSPNGSGETCILMENWTGGKMVENQTFASMPTFLSTCSNGNWNHLLVKFATNANDINCCSYPGKSMNGNVSFYINQGTVLVHDLNKNIFLLLVLSLNDKSCREGWSWR